VIDASAVLMSIVSLSGMVLVFFLPRRRSAGLAAALIGGAVCLAAYLAWVP
jgi:hypothetical protein